MSNITWANKDKNAGDGVNDKFRDVDANQVKTAVNSKEDKSAKNTANGYAGLDGAGKIPSGLLPGGGGSNTWYRGNWEIAGNDGDFPDDGDGSGTAGVIQGGDTWDIVLEDPLTPGLIGGVDCVNGGTARAKINNPGQDPANWKVQN